MKAKSFRILAPLAAMLALPAFAVTLINPVVDVIGHSGSDFATWGYGTNSYKDWGNEPFVAVNPTNPNKIVVSSFAYGTGSTTGIGANIFYSTDGGSNWGARFPIPAPSAGVGIPNDWNFAYDSAGNLHGVVLGGCNSCNIYQGMTADPNLDGQLGRLPSTWTWTGAGTRINSAGSTNKADQPWIAVGNGKVFVGYDDFSVSTSERVTVSNDNGVTFTVDNPIANTVGSFTNPGTRIALDSTGTVYSIIGIGDSKAGDLSHVLYRLNRSTNGGATWDYTAANPGPGGLIVDAGNSTQISSSASWFAGVNELRGNITAIASDALGGHVYVVYGKQDPGNGNAERLWLAEFHPVGGNLVERASPIPFSIPGQRSALPSVTVLDDGTVVVMYDAYSTQDGRVHLHVATSTDLGLSFADDQDIYNFTPLSLASIGLPSGNREFGDYQYLMHIGQTFYGAFAGVGNVNGGGINTTNLVDPFFFSGTFSAVPEPASVALVMFGMLGIGVLRRRRS